MMQVFVAIWLLLANVVVAQQSVQQTTTNSTPTTSIASSVGSEQRTVPAVEPNGQGFWPATFKDWIGVFQSVAIIAASAVAFLGINSWRREFVGKRKMELAEEVLALFYQAKDNIAFIRSPGYFASESSGRTTDPLETPEQRRIRDDAFVTRERFNRHIEAFSRIHALRYRFMAQFGRNAGSPFDQLKSALDKLTVALHQWVMLAEVDERTFSSPQSLEKHRARIEKYDEVLWGVDKDDPIASQLEEAIAAVELICRHHIDRRN